MIGFLVKLLLLYVAYKVVKEIFFSGDEKKIEEPKKGPKPDFSRSSGPKEELVQDPQCGVYFPKSSAVIHEDRYFCSCECRDSFKAKGGG